MFVLYQVCVHAMALATLLGLYVVAPPTVIPWADLVFWLLAGLACHAIQFEPGSIPGNRLRVSVGFASSVACMILFPPVLAAPLIAINSLSLRDITLNNAWYKVLFNRSMFALSGAFGATVFQALSAAHANEFGWAILCGMISGLAYYSVNTVLVTFVLAFASNRSPQQVWGSTSSFISHISYLTLSASGTAMALVYSSNDPSVVMLLGFPLAASYYTLRNTSSVEQVQGFARQLQRFVSPLTTHQIREGSEAIPGSGELREFAILFSDMRGFTSYADKLNPTLAFQLLSASLSLQTDVVIQHGGHLDKIYGDGFLAYFDGQDKVERAVACALEIRERVKYGPAQVHTETLPVSLAVHTGQVLFGFLGTRDRVDHTVAGDVVNTCARLCDIAKPFQVVTSEAVKAVLGESKRIEFRSLGCQSLRGKSEAVTLYEVRPTRSQHLADTEPSPSTLIPSIVP